MIMEMMILNDDDNGDDGDEGNGNVIITMVC